MEKRFSKTIVNPKTGRERTVKFGQAGKAADGARSAKIKGDWKSDPNSPNNLSRKKWHCQGSKSMP
jgi:hypothetical protein